MTDPGALDRAFFHGLRLTHSQALSLLSSSEKGRFGTIWTHYIDRCYPTPASRSPGLRLAVHRGLVDLVKLLIEKGVDINAVDKHGNSALFCLGSVFAPDLIPLLISNGISTDLVNNAGLTAAEFLRTRGNADSLYIEALRDYVRKSPHEN